MTTALAMSSSVSMLHRDQSCVCWRPIVDRLCVCGVEIRGLTPGASGDFGDHVVSIEMLTPNVTSFFPDDYVESLSLFMRNGTYYATVTLGSSEYSLIFGVPFSAQ